MCNSRYSFFHETDGEGRTYSAGFTHTEISDRRLILGSNRNSEAAALSLQGSGPYST